MVPDTPKGVPPVIAITSPFLAIASSFTVFLACRDHVVNVADFVDRTEWTPNKRQVPRDRLARRHADERGRRTFAGGEKARVAGNVEGDRGGDIQEARHLTQRGANGVRQIAAWLRTRGVVRQLGIRIALLFSDDQVHHLDGLDWVLAGGRLRGNHDGVGAGVDGGRHVGGLRARRHRRGDHRFQHLGCDDHRLSGGAGSAQGLDYGDYMTLYSIPYPAYRRGSAYPEPPHRRIARIARFVVPGLPIM